MSNQRVELSGTAIDHPDAARWSPAPPDLSSDVTLYLRRKHGFDPDARLSREDAEQALAADPSDLDAVHSFANQFGLKVLEENPAARTVRLSGTLADLDRAFGVDLQYVEDGKGPKHLSYQGVITIPAQVAPAIIAVLGLDRRTIAHRV